MHRSRLVVWHVLRQWVWRRTDVCTRLVLSPPPAAAPAHWQHARTRPPLQHPLDTYTAHVSSCGVFCVNRYHL
ncbi:hypothetical protein JB92DRAFT_2855415 [Gautieria morchelliformis]|nr:hypothetical protein JB92DRAFT_2855415 [Gautieria morchelliformis]